MLRLLPVLLVLTLPACTTAHEVPVQSIPAELDKQPLDRAEEAYEDARTLMEAAIDARLLPFADAAEAREDNAAAYSALADARSAYAGNRPDDYRRALAATHLNVRRMHSFAMEAFGRARK